MSARYYAYFHINFEWDLNRAESRKKNLIPSNYKTNLLKASQYYFCLLCFETLWFLARLITG